MVNGDADQTVIGNWLPAQACVDYAVYSHALPAVDRVRWEEMTLLLRSLGICQDTSIGVATIRGGGGFFQIPVYGFPELKVTFFQIGSMAERRRLLMNIAEILEIER